MRLENKLSICYTAFNSAQNLNKQFKRIFNECDNVKYKNFLEIVISDNCSTDNTKKIVNYFIKKSKQKKNIVIKYSRNKKNLGFSNNFIKLTKLVSTKYSLFMNDDDYPQKGFYREIFAKIQSKSSNTMLITPIANSRKYYPSFFGFNKVSYIINRGSILSGIILKSEQMKKYKFYSKNLYPQTELYLDYFLKHDFEDLEINSVLKNMDVKNIIKYKFNDRMKRGNDLAFFDKIEILEKFYKKHKINFVEFFYSVYSVYKWGLGVKLELNKQNSQKYENIFFNQIMRYKRKKLLKLIIFLIFIKNIFTKYSFFYFKTFRKTIL